MCFWRSRDTLNPKPVIGTSEGLLAKGGPVGNDQNRTMQDNHGQQGGAICAQGDVSLAITSSTFAGNTAENGGAMFLQLYALLLQVCHVHVVDGCPLRRRCCTHRMEGSAVRNKKLSEKKIGNMADVQQ